MKILECINSKRSCRSYTDEVIRDDMINELITLGTKASNGSGEEPWAFVVIKNKEKIDKLSEETKTHILENFEQYPYLKQYESWLKNPKFNVFNNANRLIIIYGNTKSHWYKYDCSLAAGNIMLAAHSMKIGTCWIGFAEYTCNTKEFKEEHSISENYDLVAPLSVGYMNVKLPPPTRKAPIIFYSK